VRPGAGLVHQPELGVRIVEPPFDERSCFRMNDRKFTSMSLYRFTEPRRGTSAA
jgi:hypothetical protein